MLALATVTHAANFHSERTVDENGKTVTHIHRESAGVARRQSTVGRWLPDVVDTPLETIVQNRTVDSSRPDLKRACSGVASQSKRRRRAARAEEQSNALLLSTWKQRLSTQLHASGNSRDVPSASPRIEALRLREVARAVP